MNTTMINSSIAPIPGQPLAHYNQEVEQRVQQWLASGQLLAWIPILSQENFPGVPPQILQFGYRYPTITLIPASLAAIWTGPA